MDARYASQCKYVSKPCPNERSLKDDGTFHRFCVVHRKKANDAQRRWHARRRRDSVARQSLDSDYNNTSDESEATPRKRRRLDSVQSHQPPMGLELDLARQDAISLVEVGTVWSSETVLVPVVPLVDVPAKAFASDSLLSLEDFIAELGDFITTDVQ